MHIRVLVILAIAALSAAPAMQFFYSQKIAATISDERLVEASGIEESITNPGYFWTHNDSGGEPVLYLIDGQGVIVTEVELEGVSNRDWEEIVTVKEGDQSFIYVAEMGDNYGFYSNVSLIRLEEPVFDGTKNQQVRIGDADIMRFTYEEGARDAEALLFDSRFNEFVLVTKREKHAMVYSFPFTPNRTTTIKAKGTIPSRLFTAADMNESGEILLKSYGSIYYWSPSEERAVDRILKWNGQEIDYTPEPQGEAICWRQKNFYTISEKNEGKPQEMLFFERMN